MRRRYASFATIILPHINLISFVDQWNHDYAPYWRTIGTHMYWAPKLLELAEGYLRRHFGVQPGEAIPPASPLPSTSFSYPTH